MRTHECSPARTCCVCFTMLFSSPSVLKGIFQVKLTPHWHICGWLVPPLRADLQNSALQRQNAIQILSKLSLCDLCCDGQVWFRFRENTLYKLIPNQCKFNQKSLMPFSQVGWFLPFRAKLNSKCSSHKIFTGEFVNSGALITLQTLRFSEYLYFITKKVIKTFLLQTFKNNVVFI